MAENKKIISPDEFKKRMKEIEIKVEAGFWVLDKEEAHIQMDNLMCEILSSLGYEAGVEIFQNTEKYYA